MGKCSFGRVILSNIFVAKYPWGTNLEGRFLYIEDSGKQWLLAVFDFSGTFRHTCLKWREAVSRATGIPVANIWYHELQTHAAPISNELDGEPCENLINLCIPEIKDMIRRAEEAELSHMIIDFGSKFNLNREQYIPELGSVTVWAGLQFDGEGRPYSKNPDIMNLYGYKPDVPAFEKNIYFDRSVDSQGALLAFRSKSGKILGTITRFAAHPDVAVLFESMDITDQYRYHFDWPGYLRYEIDRSIGGIGLYVNGPCGNLSVKKGYEGMSTYEACDKEAYRIAKEIADAFLVEWEKTEPVWKDIEINSTRSTKVELPIRDTIPESLEKVNNMDEAIICAETALKKAIENHLSPAKVKKLIDEKMHQRSINTIVNSWVGLSESELKRRTASVELGTVSLNGLVFAGLPGECLTETCRSIKADTIGNRLVVLDQVNGYMGYMTTPESYDHGGYSYWGSWLARDAEPLMRKRIVELIRSL